ncbi:putative neutral zinc metallopeptidase [Botrimarina colliarenosi]|uniref:Putative neutral zinc metallopeptidase n=1 Tax=Botrimarina colliarenosi TaxID=2528001 RepID=A0A5C6A8Y0_9BACT|nr:zinc metallopeptidase [Botrimarina colliarenosi]TWT94783.1 putative neutral zinc metallopeptidase [Botrimarina colliarenosi]
MIFDAYYFLFIAPAFLLALWAQARTKSAYAAASQEPANLTGAAAARHLLDSAGLQNVTIEPIAGQLTDHYDPTARVLRLSEGVYGARNLAAVGIAAHEAGHALQHAKGYAPLAIRNAAVPAANFGSGLGGLIILGGLLFQSSPLLWAGIAAFSAVVFFQLVNLPVEFDASNRAKAQLVSYGIVPEQEMTHVNRVLNAAAWTYVAATLQSIMVLLYYVWRFAGSSNR